MPYNSIICENWKKSFLSLNIMSHDDSILFIILCVSYVIFSPFIWNDSYLKLCSTGITNLGLNSDMIFKSYLHPIFIWCKSLRESSLSSNIVSDDYCIYIIIVLVSYVRSFPDFCNDLCMKYVLLLKPSLDLIQTWISNHIFILIFFEVNAEERFLYLRMLCLMTILFTS